MGHSPTSFSFSFSFGLVTGRDDNDGHGGNVDDSEGGFDPPADCDTSTV